MKQLSPAEKILQNLGITEPEEIDLEAIAFTQNVYIERRDMDGCEARIMGVENKAIISIDSRRYPQRQRFSIAHELGHWKNDRGQSFVCMSEDIGHQFISDKFSEKMANRFAANLLLPPYLFLPILRDFSDLTWKTVKEIARKFNMSLTATAIQIIESNEFPAILIAHSGIKRKWFSKASRIPKRWFPQDHLVSNSRVYNNIKNKNSFSGNEFIVTADTWFDREVSDEFEIVEQTIQIGNDEILTILVFTEKQMLEEQE